MIEKTSFTLSVVNNALQHKKKFVKTRYVDKHIIKALYSMNLILGLTRINNQYLIKINVGMSNKFKIVNWFRKHSKTYMSPKQITKLKLNHQAGLYIFSTSVGLVDQHYLIRNNISGFLVFQVVLK